MINTSVLRARNTEKHLMWMTGLEPIVADALQGSGQTAGYRARAITLAALTCLDASSAEWALCEAAVDFCQLLDDAFALLKPATLRD